MVSEARRGAVRIVANYARVFTNIFLGLIVVRFVLHAAGDEGWALIALLAPTVGLASMVQEGVRTSLIREMGHAFHSGRPEHFRSVYNAALLVSAVLALVTVFVFVAWYLAIPIFEISDELLPAARWLVVTRGFEMCVGLVLSPAFNMYRATERMVAYNVWIMVNRACFVVAALIVMPMAGRYPAGTIVTWYAIIQTGLVVLAELAAALVMIRLDPRLVPAPSTITREALRTVVHVGGWNAAASTATLSHRRISPLVMNFAFGLWGNLVLGLGLQLSVAVRRLAVGMTEGLDAVTARLSATRPPSAVHELLHYSTRLHGVASFPVAIAILALAEPILRLWVGDKLQDPGATLPVAVTLVQILTLGTVARAISDCWVQILYGTGKVLAFAPFLVAGAAANPIASVLLLWLLPDPVRYTAVAWGFTGAVAIFHGILVPVAGTRALGLSLNQFYGPLLRPLVIAVACFPVLLLGHGSIPALLASLAAYGVLYSAGCVVFAMDAAERRRFGRAALRRLPGLGPSRPQP